MFGFDYFLGNYFFHPKALSQAALNTKFEYKISYFNHTLNSSLDLNNGGAGILSGGM